MNSIINFPEHTFFFIIIIFVFFVTFKNIKLRTTGFSLTRANSDFLKGFFILAIVFHHLIQKISEPGLLRVYQEAGYLSVGMFLFLSGYGLSRSQSAINQTFIHYAKCKLIRVYVPTVLINIGLLYFLNLQIEIYQVFIPSSVDATQWFISAIIVVYFFYYLITNAFVNNAIVVFLFCLFYILLCFLSGINLYWYISILCFPLGIFWQTKEEALTRFFNDMNLALMLLFMLVFLLLFTVKQFFSGVGIIFSPVFCLMILFLNARYEFNSVLMSTIGKCSLEIYILHLKLIWCLTYFLSLNIVNSSILLIPYFIILIVASYIFFLFNDYLLKFVKS